MSSQVELRSQILKKIKDLQEKIPEARADRVRDRTILIAEQKRKLIELKNQDPAAKEKLALEKLRIEYELKMISLKL